MSNPLAPINIVCDDDQDFHNMAAVITRWRTAMEALQHFVSVASACKPEDPRFDANMDKAVGELVKRIQKCYEAMPQLTADVDFLRTIAVCIPGGRA